LTHVEDDSKAVVLDCLHEFCVPCISRWAKLRRECPLCKGFFKAYIHGIVSATSFKECNLSPLRPHDSKDAIGSEDAVQVSISKRSKSLPSASGRVVPGKVCTHHRKPCALHARSSSPQLHR
jgi:Ring finger domain